MCMTHYTSPTHHGHFTTTPQEGTLSQVIEHFLIGDTHLLFHTYIKNMDM